MTYPIIQEKMSNEVISILKKYGIKAQPKALNQLTKTIQNTIAFNQELYSIGTLSAVSLATSAEDLIAIFMLRDEVYREIGYRDEFPEIIKGLHFDAYDEHSAIIYTKRGIVTGTCRLVFDSIDNKLPTDEKVSVDYLRNTDRKLAEASRVIIRNKEGLKQEFKGMAIDSYRILSSYKMNAISVMPEEYLKMYQNFGGFSIEKTLNKYGSIEKEFFLTIWDCSQVSTYFKRIFLRNVKLI